MNKDAEEIVELLGMTRHPEGGYFKEVYRSEEMIPGSALPERYSGARCSGTSIYFLLCGDQKSHLHRIKSDETWHYYKGSSLRLYVITPEGEMKIHLLGSNFKNKELPQITIEHGSWFGAEVCDEDSYTLVGCTVAPGFDYNDFELARRENLLIDYPQHKEIINLLT